MPKKYSVLGPDVTFPHHGTQLPLRQLHLHLIQMVLATYSIVRATLNSEEVNQECVARYKLSLST